MTMTGGKPECLGINLCQCDLEHNQPHTDGHRLEAGSLPLNGRINVQYKRIWSLNFVLHREYSVTTLAIQSV